MANFDLKNSPERYVLYGVKYIDVASLAPVSGGGVLT